MQANCYRPIKDIDQLLSIVIVKQNFQTIFFYTEEHIFISTFKRFQLYTVS